ncbi:MAG: ATP-binding protein [Candidatus Lokiarchaeota archaeon]|nr:ATP-binding protein [Candidatus Lokiarchaeota archaeon]
MKILVIGNIGAGKSTLIAWLKDKIGYPVVGIDDLRMHFGDGTIAGEYLAQYHFLKACASRDALIIEFSGAGAHKHAIMLALKESTMQVHVILVDTPLSTCLQRRTDSAFTIPYPKWDVPISEVIPRLQAELDSDVNKGFWTAGGRFAFARIKSDDLAARDVLLRSIERRC